MSQHHPHPPELPADHHALLADPLRRRVLAHSQDSASDVASLEEVANDVQTPEGADADTLRIRLHHSVLPRLAAAGVLEYDPRSNTVRYHDHAVLDYLDERLTP